MFAWFKGLFRRNKKQCETCRVKIQSEAGERLHQDVHGLDVQEATHNVQEDLPGWVAPTKIVVSPEEFDRIVRFIQNSSPTNEALNELLRQDDKTWKN